MLLFLLAIAATPSAAASAPTAYPQAWIDASFADRPSSCGHLVYKKGCSKLRKGRVEAVVTLDGSGKVTNVRIESNTVTVDPKLVTDCIKKDFRTRQFHAPEAGMAREWRYVLVLSDMC